MKDRRYHAGMTKASDNPRAVPSGTSSVEGLVLMCQQAITTLVERLPLGRPLAVIDLETTGISVERDRVVQLGIIRIEPNGQYYEMDSLVNPEMRIPPDATAIHGIDDRMVAAAPTFTTLSPEVTQLLTGCDLAGFNAQRFDRRLLEAEYRRVGVPCPMQGAKLVDAFRIFVQREARTLAGAVRFYCGLADFHGHTAIDDARATVCVLAGQLAKYCDLPASVQGLDELCDPRDPSWVDPAGKIAFADGVPCLTFGKFARRSLPELARAEPGYLRWMLDSDFSEGVKGVIRDALRGIFPVAPASQNRGSDGEDTGCLVVEDPAQPEGTVEHVDDVSCPEVPDSEWFEIEEIEDANRPEAAGQPAAVLDDRTEVPDEDLIPRATAFSVRRGLRLVTK